MTHPLRNIKIFLFISIIFSQDPEALIDNGNLQLSNGNYSEAEILYNSALKLDPSFAPALQALSKLYLHLGNLNKANDFSNQAVQADEDYREWSNKITQIKENIQNGNRDVQEGRFNDAIEKYSMVLKEHPYFPDAEFYKGLTRFRQKDIDGAAEHFSNALKIYPEHPKARKGLDNVTKQFLNGGNKAYKRGDLMKATNYYKKALIYDSEFYLAYYQLGVLEKKQGNSDKAIQYLNKVIEIKPDHDKTLFTIGSVYESDGSVDDAIIYYNKAIEINPNYSKAYGNLGKLYTDKENYNEAEDVLNTVIQLDPSYANGFFRLGDLFIKQELWEIAIKNLLISVELDNKDYNKFEKLAHAYNQIEKWDEAANFAQKCTDMKRRSGGGWYELGFAEFGKGNKTRAKKHFEEAYKDRDWRKLAGRKIDEINNPAKYQK